MPESDPFGGEVVVGAKVPLEEVADDRLRAREAMWTRSLKRTLAVRRPASRSFRVRFFIRRAVNLLG